MLLAALLVQAHPTASPLAEVIAYVHLQHRADTREGVNVKGGGKIYQCGGAKVSHLAAGF